MNSRGAAVDESPTLFIERVFDAPRELVWEAWTDEKRARSWWAPQGLEVTLLEMDVRPGGSWRKCMRTTDGKESWRSGEFVEVKRPERLAFTYHSDDPNSDPRHATVVIVTLEEAGRRTRLTLEQKTFESVAARNAHKGGWSSSMDRLGDYLSQQGGDRRKGDADDLPRGLAAPARRALNGAGYFRLGQLDGASEADLLKLHGMGRKAVETLRGSLLERGMSLSE